MIDKKDNERFWNLWIFKVWAADDELADLAPSAVIITLVLIVVLWILW